MSREQRENGSLARDAGADPSQALDRLVPQMYDELRRIAHLQLRRERGDHTLGAACRESPPAAGR